MLLWQVAVTWGKDWASIRFFQRWIIFCMKHWAAEWKLSCAELLASCVLSVKSLKLQLKWIAGRVGIKIPPGSQGCGGPTGTCDWKTVHDWQTPLPGSVLRVQVIPPHVAAVFCGFVPTAAMFTPTLTKWCQVGDGSNGMTYTKSNSTSLVAFHLHRKMPFWWTNWSARLYVSGYTLECLAIPFLPTAAGPAKNGKITIFSKMPHIRF